jgi:hypothetical protein
MATLKRYDIKKLLARPDLRRRLIVESTRLTQAREDIEVSKEQVENSYYVVTEGERASFFGLVSFRTEGGDNDGRHSEFVKSLNNKFSGARNDVSLRDFASIDGSPLAFDRLSLVGPLFRANPKLDPTHASAVQGLATADDPRFVRCWWEISTKPDDSKRRWVPFAKGGSFSRFYSDVYLMVFWEDNGAALRRFEKSVIRNPDFYFRSGLTWPLRTQRGFNIRVLPPTCIFGHKGPAIFPKKPAQQIFLLGVLNSALAEYLLKCVVSFGSWEVGAVKKIPIPSPSADSETAINELASRLHDLKSVWDTGNEVCTHFDRPWTLQPSVKGEAPTIASVLDAVLARETALDSELAKAYAQLNDSVYRLYGVHDSLRSRIEAAIGERPPEIAWPQMEGQSTDQKRMEHVCRLLSYMVKCVVEEDNAGLVSLESVAQEQPLLERVRAKLAGFFPEQDPHTLEIEIVNELKKRVKGYPRAESLQEWLTDRFFDFHCGLYQQRPILWHLASSQDAADPAFSVIVAYHRFDHDLLAKLRSVHVRDRMTTLRREAAQAGKDNREDDRLQLLAALEEVESFDRKLARLQEGHHSGTEGGDQDYRILTPWKKPQERPKGWQPDIDDGVKVNIAPLARLGLLRIKNKFGAKDLEDE